jgi:hypothetical protein
MIKIWKFIFFWGSMIVLLLTGMSRPVKVMAQQLNIYASPIQAGCYLAKLDRCKIHVEPFTINLVPGTKLVNFKLVAIRVGPGTQYLLYDFRPDASNPVPFSGSTFTPSPVAKDFGATCGQTYIVSLQGQDTGDLSVFNLGTTDPFTCPKGTFKTELPVITR